MKNRRTEDHMQGMGSSWGRQSHHPTTGAHLWTETASAKGGKQDLCKSLIICTSP